MQRRYYYTHKKSKKKSSTKTNNGWLRTALYILMGTLCVWLCAILWFHTSSGKIGTEVAKGLHQLLGGSAGLLPVFLAYWLVQTIRNKSASFLFFLLGTSITLVSFSSVCTCLRQIFTGSLISGGLVGEKVFFSLKGIIGSVGAALFSLAFVLVGLHILVAIPWRTVLTKTAEFIKNDFNGWMDSRAELKQKVAEGKQEIKEKAEAAENRPVAEEVRELPQIRRAKPEIRRPVAEPITELPRQEDPAPKKATQT